jgi:hypothetical protein
MLRAAGLQVYADGEELVVRGSLPPYLRELAIAHKPQVMADLAEEAALTCPPGADHFPNHPWPGRPIRCVRCGLPIL